MELPQYADAFRDKEVDGPTLLELTDETLEYPLGISDPLKRKKIVGHIKLLKIRDDQEVWQNVATAGRRTPVGQVRRRSPQSDAASGRSTPSGPAQGGMRGTPTRSVSGQVHRVRRNRSAGSVGTKTPRSVSASSERSLDPGGISVRSWGEEVSLYTDYTNPNPQITQGLVSNFGIDSPSFSRRGSFPHSGRKQVFPGVPTNGATAAPGPDRYDISKDNVDRVKTASPKASIGRAPRNTVEYFVSSSASPGVGKYDVQGSQSPGNTFSVTPRFNYGTTQTRNWLTPRRGPGPADYRPSRSYDSTFHT